MPTDEYPAGVGGYAFATATEIAQPDFKPVFKSCEGWEPSEKDLRIPKGFSMTFTGRIDNVGNTKLLKILFQKHLPRKRKKAIQRRFKKRLSSLIAPLIKRYLQASLPWEGVFPIIAYAILGGRRNSEGRVLVYIKDAEQYYLTRLINKNMLNIIKSL